MTHILEIAAQQEEVSLARQIRALVARLHPEVTVERRHDQRFAMPVLMKLTPLDTHHAPLEQMATIVVGKDISRSGISFFHERPLPFRWAIVSLEHPAIGQFAAEIDINWCRFTRPGWYVSGGRLLGEATAASSIGSGTGRESGLAAG
jgi:hypothetical protein